MSWQDFSLEEQLANIGAEVGRAAKWQGKDDKSFEGAFWRALELFDRTLEDKRWRGRLREVALLRELFCEAAAARSIYNTALQDLEKYFMPFMYLTAKKR